MEKRLNKEIKISKGENKLIFGTTNRISLDNFYISISKKIIFNEDKDLTSIYNKSFKEIKNEIRKYIISNKKLNKDFLFDFNFNKLSLKKGIKSKVYVDIYISPSSPNSFKKIKDFEYIANELYDIVNDKLFMKYGL